MTESHRGGFHHIDLNVSDLAASKAVYGPVLEYLGYRCVKDEPQGCEWDMGPDGRGASLGIKACDPLLASHRHERYAPGLHHLAWRAESRADVDALHVLLVERGIKILDRAGALSRIFEAIIMRCSSRIPDGMKLELVYAPGMDLTPVRPAR